MSEAKRQLIATVRETLLQHFFEVNYVMRNRHNEILIINISVDGETPSFIGWKLSQNSQHSIVYPFFLIHFMVMNDTLSTKKLGIKNYPPSWTLAGFSPKIMRGNPPSNVL